MGYNTITPKNEGCGFPWYLLNLLGPTAGEFQVTPGPSSHSSAPFTPRPWQHHYRYHTTNLWPNNAITHSIHGTGIIYLHEWLIFMVN